MAGKTESVPFDEVAAAALSACPGLLQDWFPAGRLEGREFCVGDLQGSVGRSLKINVDTGRWSDFAGDVSGGDLISLYAARGRLDNQGAACRQLAEELGLADRLNGRSVPAQAKTKWTPVHPISADAPAPNFDHRRHGSPSTVWTYRDGAGALLGHVCRFDVGPGKKEILPLSYCEGDAGRRSWRWLSFAKPRPLYGLDRLAAAPEQANVIVCEGEKAADACQILIPAAVAVTWPGGSKAWHLADWSPLQGRKVVVWPDADAPGRKAADGWHDDHGVWHRGIAQTLTADHGCQVRVAYPEPELPEGFDAADFDAAERGPVLEWLRARFREPSMPPPAYDAGDPGPVPDPGDYEAPDPEPVTNGAPFRLLGYNRSVFYYYPYGGKQIVELTASQHKREQLLRLAPLHWWEREYPAKGGADWTAAANHLFRQQDTHGVFVGDKRQRGRGVWFDEGRAIFNLGDRLLVDGREETFPGLRTRFVYEAGESLTGDLGEPLRGDEASRLLDISCDLRWERPISGYLLAGWIVVAPLSGALDWRPHIWITGPAGSGKTTVMRDLVWRALEAVAYEFDGKSTEAAMRQRMGHDALPVIFDEPEQQDERSRQRVQDVIDFARLASSGGVQYKGTQTQSGARAYLARSAICMSSIHVGVTHYQDETRFTPLVLLPPPRGDEEIREAARAQYEELQRNLAETFAGDFSGRLLMRSVQLLPVILESARVFTAAVAAHLGDRRIGDQLGQLLAGAWSLRKSRAPTFDEALTWIRDRDWSEHTPVEGPKNENKLLARILQHQVRVSTGNGVSHERTLGELVDAARGDDQLIARDTADMTLRRYGLKFEGGVMVPPTEQGIWIANQHSALSRILRDTPWSAQWRGPLLALEGAKKSEQAIRFASGAVSRAVFVPLVSFDEV